MSTRLPVDQTCVLQRRAYHASDARTHTSYVLCCTTRKSTRRSCVITYEMIKPHPEKYQAMVLCRTEDQLLLKSGNIDIRTTEKTNLLGVVLNNKPKFDNRVSSICRKASAQINVLNRLKNILSLKTKESLYRSFILPNIYYCNQVWHHCGKRNTIKSIKSTEGR